MQIAWGTARRIDQRGLVAIPPIFQAGKRYSIRWRCLDTSAYRLQVHTASEEEDFAELGGHFHLPVRSALLHKYM